MKNLIPGLAFLLTLAIWPWWANASVAPKSIVLCFGLIACLFVFRKAIKLSSWGLALCVYAALSALWAPIWPDTLGGLWQVLVLTLGLSLGAICPVDKVLRWFSYGVLLNIALAFAQHNGFFLQILSTDFQPAGTFVNKNFLGEVVALAFVFAVIDRRWALALAIAPGFWLAQSKEAVAAAILGIASSIWPRAWPLVLAPLALAAYWWNPTSFAVRFSLWSEALAGASLLGHGIGQFYTMIPFYSSDTLVLRNDHAHNLWIELFFELGAFGLVWSVAIFTVAYWRAHSARPLVLALAALCTVGFPLWLPNTLFISSLLLGACLTGTVGLWPERLSWLGIIRKGYDRGRQSKAFACSADLSNGS